MMTTVAVAFISALAMLFGVVITTSVNAWMNASARKTDERLRIKQLIVTAALENRRQTAELFVKSGRGERHLMPIEVFMIHAVHMVDVMFDPTTNASNFEQRMAQVDEITALASERAKETTRRINGDLD